MSDDMGHGDTGHGDTGHGGTGSDRDARGDRGPGAGEAWDRAIDAAWADFRRRLADRLAGLGTDEILLLALPDEHLAGAAAYSQVLAGPGVLLVEAVGNRHLDATCRLDDAQEQRLRDLGLADPDDDTPGFWVLLEQREADRAAWIMVRALREVYGVLHPSYLTGADLGTAPGAGADGAATDPGATAREPAGGAPPLPEGDGPWHPQDRDEVRGMLLRAAEPLVDGEPTLDDDGDLSIRVGDCALWVTPAVRTPRLLLSAVLVTDVVDTERAMLETTLLNRQEIGLTFVLDRDRQVVVRREISVEQFAPRVVRTEMERILDHLDRWSDDLVARVGGRAPFDVRGPLRPEEGRGGATPDPDARLVAALAVLRELEKEDRDAITPALLVDVFHGDRDLLMGALRETREQEEAWQERGKRAEERGASSWARRCRAHVRYQRDLRGRLRRALRTAVQRTGRERPEQLSLFSEDEATT